MVVEPGIVSKQARVPRVKFLKDGAGVQLSLIGPADKRDFLAGMAHLSRQSRYLRFFSHMPVLPKPILDGLLNTDSSDHVAIGARLLAADGQVCAPIIGVARYHRSADDANVAEPAVAVIDLLHGRGLGSLLLRVLSSHAREQGITHFRAHALASNDRIRGMLHAAQGRIVDHDGAVLVYDVDIRRRSQRRRRRGLLARMRKATCQPFVRGPGRGQSPGIRYRHRPRN